MFVIFHQAMSLGIKNKYCDLKFQLFPSWLNDTLNMFQRYLALCEKFTRNNKPINMKFIVEHFP